MIKKRSKGLAPVVSTVFLTSLGILLISTLFSSLHISNTALIESIRLDQAREQEEIALFGPGALNLTSVDLVRCLEVHNRGPVTVQLRAVYIGQQFICDPSQFEGDAYIKPNESFWVQFLDNSVLIHLNGSTINADWTVTTELGTSASETGGNLMWGDPEDPYPIVKAFHIGPFMIWFDVFHWQSGTGPWRSGWSIPKSTRDVTWRILVVNVATKDIVISEPSCLTLISNENSPKDPLPFYVDPNRTQMTFEPGVFNFVYYTWSKAASEGGASMQDITGMQDLTTCISFLTFYGAYIEPDGTRTPLGQIIPFEAVLVTDLYMADSMDLIAAPSAILNDGLSQSTITAVVRDGDGNPLPDVWVEFYASTGTLSTTRDTTDETGVVKVTLSSSLAPSIASVTAVCQSVVGNCFVVFTPATNMTVTAVPSSISISGASTITVQMVDGGGSPVAQSGIPLTVEISAWISSGSSAPILTYEGTSGTSLPVTTDANGRASLTLHAQGVAGTATIRAIMDGLNSGETEVEIVG